MCNGHILAVKKLITDRHNQDELEKKVEKECRILQSLDHENVIKCLGSFSQIDKDLYLLVYEFMEHGALDTALPELLWGATEIARGLECLQTNECSTIIHRDLQISNILLDENHNAKLSGFGLATVHNIGDPIDDDFGRTNGYMAPEYAMREIISDKTDIYSFGILLLEIVTGQSNAVVSSSGQRKFHLDKVAACYREEKEEKLLDMVDKNLVNAYHRGKALTILKLAMACTNTSPASRPSISEVVSILERPIQPIPPIFLCPLCTAATGIGKQHSDTCSDKEGSCSRPAIE